MASFARGILHFKPNFRSYATKRDKSVTPRKAGPKIDATAASLAAKGFLRPQREYRPPQDLREQLEPIFTQILGTADVETRVNDLNKRFELFCACENQLQHKIPNSLLHTIETLGDVVRYYKTPVDTITPLDNLRNLDLPKNLHVQYEYMRFHPDTDRKFGGVTAFHGSSTLVTGLKTRKKYEGHKQKLQYPNIV